MRRSIIPSGRCVIATWWLVQATAWACPLCKEALLDPGQAASQSRLARAYAMSIAVLLGVPVAVMGIIVWRLVRASRQTH